MLTSLILSNFVIIDKLEITFNKGYSVFTGETGAGKSIILEALTLTAGGKASSNIVKEGTEKATIIATYTTNQVIISLLKKHEIELEDNEVIIKRIINNNGTSKSFINDSPVSINLLKLVGNLILDIHGQFDNQKLLNNKFHLELLDNFVEKPLLEQTAAAHQSYKAALNDYNNLLNSVNSVEAEKEYLKYAVEELENANLQANEELELVEKRTLALEKEKLSTTLKEASGIFNNEYNILANINHVIKQLEKIKNYLSANSSYNNLLDKLNNSYSELLDSEALLFDLESSLGQENLNLEQIEERLILLRTLAKKYKVTSNELPEVLTNFSEKLNNLQHNEGNLKDKLTTLETAKANFITAATKLQQQRQKAANYLSQKVNQELVDLHLKGVNFYPEVVNLTNNEAAYNSLGFNQVNFKIINNLSKEAKDINKVASGGELARIMLAIKIALAEKTAPLLIIFDEIDVGVGGEVAYSIGKKLSTLANFSQVIAVTHSHQVAALAGQHYKVTKILNNKINTVVSLLDFDSRVMELARMVSANKITSDAKAIALSLLKAN